LSDLATFFAFIDTSRIDQHAASYLRFGVGKRLSLIFNDVRWLTSTCPEYRTETLSDEECKQAGLHINSFYLNVRGVLDNFAWALYWLISPTDAAKTEADNKSAQIGLFQKPVLLLFPETSDLRKTIDHHRDWSFNLKRRRDPAAHRLPLRVVPQVIVEENLTRYRELQQQYFENINKLAVDLRRSDDMVTDDSIAGINKRCEQIERIKEAHDRTQSDLSLEMQSQGQFVPLFTYSAGMQELIPLYPTLTDDINHLLRLSAACKAHIVSLID
jgi:hypothetical protein